MPSIIERNVDPTEVLSKVKRPIEDFEKDVAYLSEHMNELIESYPNEWVAIYHEAVAAHSRRSRDLQKQLRSLGIDRSTTVVYFLSTKPTMLVL